MSVTSSPFPVAHFVSPFSRLPLVRSLLDRATNHSTNSTNSVPHENYSQESKSKSSSPRPLLPTMETYNGHVKTPADAIILFEACRIGLLPRVQRRLSEKERQQIKSGSVFVWDEREAGMRRWTDGKSWSASRVSGSFLTYREMEGKRGGNGYATTPQPQRKPSPKVDAKLGDSDEEGPDGYRYKPDGLMKQSFSITTSSGQHLHLISYYARSSPNAPNLMQPSTDPNLRHIRPPKNMYPESTVNESANIPAVTRAPMAPTHYPTGSPQPITGSPFSRAPMPGYIQAGAWPPTPSATPPAAYAVYYPYPPGQPLHFAPMHPHHYPSHVAPAPHLDRVPPHVPNNQLPPSLAGGHHYLHNTVPRASPGYPPYPNQAQYAPSTEPGPQLPQLGAHVADHSHPSPQQNSNARPQVLSVPDQQSSATSPARQGAATSLSNILNSAPVQSAETQNDQSTSRSGSKSPANAGFSMKTQIESTAPLRAANQAISALNSTALST